MGKTYQALQKAEKEYQKRLHGSLPGVKQKAIRQPEPDALILDKTEFFPIQTGNGLSEQYESLKSNIFSRFAPEKLKTMVFTSASYGDGTSTTAANFASALARDPWRSVLIVDADIRRPCLHKVFNLELTHGLSDFLSDETLDEPQPNKISNNFYFQTSGLLGARAVGLFESVKFNHFLETVSNRFDHVIIDCPPVTAFPETRIIAGKVKGVVLVVNFGKTKNLAALRVKKDLQEAGANILGAVLNKRKFFIPNWLYKKL